MQLYRIFQKALRMFFTLQLSFFYTTSSSRSISIMIFFGFENNSRLRCSMKAEKFLVPLIQFIPTSPTLYKFTALFTWFFASLPLAEN